MHEEHRSLIAENLGYAAGNGHRVLERPCERPIMSVNEVRELTGTTYPAANQLVERLVKIGVARRVTAVSFIARTCVFLMNRQRAETTLKTKVNSAFSARSSLPFPIWLPALRAVR
jgi:hypothetical protein